MACSCLQALTQAWLFEMEGGQATGRAREVTEREGRLFANCAWEALGGPSLTQGKLEESRFKATQWLQNCCLRPPPASLQCDFTAPPCKREVSPQLDLRTVDSGLAESCSDR